ncbi:nitrite reductase small subunit NirD [Ferrovum sp.]|uniref:nitrite reductase small subunit NirD n=1 Tax=Ferrovum sp. TaxID=2609467 RepID=UPI0013BC7FA2|nr:nitrite reductase small subunit NirD [Ferrovum sp.]NDU86627.1 nitrite reductase small subunit NirD [Ferrovum sp.]
MAQWKRICTLDEIPRLGARVVERGAPPNIALFRTADDQVFALLDQCPHKQGPLSQGLVTDTHVTCPLHGWRISLVDGQAQGADAGCAATVPVQLEDGWISLESSHESH